MFDMSWVVMVVFMVGVSLVGSARSSGSTFALALNHFRTDVSLKVAEGFFSFMLRG